MPRGNLARHGHYRQGKGSPTYVTWRAMHIRCSDPNHKAFSRYGGRGITVCDRWNDFVLFLEDMGERPAGTSIDRIDNSKGYFKENCRWASIETQSANRSVPIKAGCRRITYKGRTLSTAEWARELGVSPESLYTRIHRGWSDDDVIGKPFRRRST